MRQFDICRLKRQKQQMVVILQHDVADDLDSRIVAPLSNVPYSRLVVRVRLPVDIEGVAYVIQFDRLAAIARTEIGEVVGSLAADERRMKNALDLLFFGV